MSLFWYPELNDKIEYNGKLEKGVLISSYIKYFLARLQSMFVYEGLPETMPAKWLENLLLVNGYALIIENGNKGLIATNCGVGGAPDVYYIPTECIVTNPYAETSTNRTYTRDVDSVLMVNDTYAQGLMPMLKKYCTMLAENDITLNIADILSRATIILSACDDKTKDSAKLFIKHLFDGELDIIGESQFLAGGQEHALTVNQLTRSNDTITNLIEYHQYIKASLYNELGLQSNYNMKRESINSGESQLNDDMLHPLIDTMLRERQEGVERINKMFGTNISVKFNSAWALNEREQNAEIKAIETTPETAPDTVPETAPETAPDTVPESEPDTSPDTAPDTVPESEPDTAPESEPDTAPDTTPDIEINIINGGNDNVQN